MRVLDLFCFSDLLIRWWSLGSGGSHNLVFAGFRLREVVTFSSLTPALHRGSPDSVSISASPGLVLNWLSFLAFDFGFLSLVKVNFHLRALSPSLKMINVHAGISKVGFDWSRLKFFEAFDLSDSTLGWSELRAVRLNGFSFVYVSPTAELRRAVSLTPEEEICLASWRVVIDCWAIDHVVEAWSFLSQRFFFWAYGPEVFMYISLLFRPFVYVFTFLYWASSYIGPCPFNKSLVTKKKKKKKFRKKYNLSNSFPI